LLIIKDANRLKEQFFNTLYDDPDGLNKRSAFYTAQSYMDSDHFLEAIQWYSLYTKLKNTWIEEVYISYISIAKCLIKLKNYMNLKKSSKKNSKVIIFLNQIKNGFQKNNF
jgi:hypothetical protein